jgi:AMP deaminase
MLSLKYKCSDYSCIIVNFKIFEFDCSLCVKMVLINLRRAKDFETKSQQYEPIFGTPDEGDNSVQSKDEEFDFTPHFERVSVSGEDTSGVSILL